MPKIYTKTGDDGSTSLFAGGRVSKDDVRLHAYGTVDELNSILGLALSLGVEASLQGPLNRIQGELFTLGADLATPLDASPEWLVRLEQAAVERLEKEIDAWDDELPALTNFILPGGSSAAAALHHARTVCRRAERWMVSIREDFNPTALIYVNRLSDWLFTVARVHNHRSGITDPIWKSR